MLPSSSAVPSTITDVLFVDTDVATGMYGPSLREKYRVHAASTTDSAIQYLARNAPALVITELVFGGASGVDICRQAKALPVPSTVLVTTSDVTRVPDALAAGCDGVLLKPFALNLLHGRIGRLLRGRLAELRLNAQRQYVRTAPMDGGNGNGNGNGRSSGSNHVWPQLQCPHCDHDGVTSFEFSSHRRSWYACLHCKQVWIGKRQE